jgi:hypothetical protein
MRRWLYAAATALLAALAIPGAALALTFGGPQTPMHVTPRPVGPHRTVTISFRQPVDTTSSSSLQTTERLDVQGPRRAGCVDRDNLIVGAAEAGSQVQVTLRPGVHHHWCLGFYRGTLTVSMMPRCGPPVRVCPQFVIAPRTVGHFTFSVKARKAPKLGKLH